MANILRSVVVTALVSTSLFLACGGDSEGEGGSAGKGGSGGSSGGAGEGGESGTAGKANTGGSAGKAGAGGSTGKGGSAGTSSAGGPAGGDGGNSGGEGGISGGEGGGSGAGGDTSDVPPTVTTFGCFAQSGDGWDFLDGSTHAFTVSTDRGCGTEISDNANAYAPETIPTSFVVTRKFILAPIIRDTGVFTLSFGADDAVAFVLNGVPVAACNPPSSDVGQCSSTLCRSVSVARSALLGGGQVNTLEIEVTNLLSIDAGDGNFGYTGAWYSFCGVAE